MKKRWIVLPLAILSVLAAAFFFTWPILTGKTTPPEVARNTANRAVEDARAAQAETWASELLESAEARLHEGLTEYRDQELRFLPMRDFAVAESLLVLAANTAKQAAEEATAAKSDSREAADTVLKRAEAAVLASSALASNLNLEREERSLLNRSRLYMSRAKQRWREGDYPEAKRLAEFASTWAGDLGERCSQRAARYTQAHLIRDWRRMAQETIDWSRRTGKAAIVVTKATHRLVLYRGGVAKLSYPCDIGYNNVEDKLLSGDGATPEGRYTISQKKGRGQSKYYKAFLLDYPNSEDRMNFQAAKRKGLLPRGATPGGLIEIHGDGGRGKDWTKGCVAVTNDQMDALFKHVDVGTPVTIVGSDGDGGVFADLVQRFQKATRGKGG
jgi:L,D-peptidoglycan transpeptidase YkuD (ErfK/YbiS/YcfS/YnhG family)